MSKKLLTKFELMGAFGVTTIWAITLIGTMVFGRGLPLTAALEAFSVVASWVFHCTLVLAVLRLSEKPKFLYFKAVGAGTILHTIDFWFLSEILFGDSGFVSASDAFMALFASLVSLIVTILLLIHILMRTLRMSSNHEMLARYIIVGGGVACYMFSIAQADLLKHWDIVTLRNFREWTTEPLRESPVKAIPFQVDYETSPDLTPAHYLRLCRQLVSDLKRVGVKAVLVELPSFLEDSDEIKAGLATLDSTGIVVFGQPWEKEGWEHAGLDIWGTTKWRQAAFSVANRSGLLDNYRHGGVSDFASEGDGFYSINAMHFFPTGYREYRREYIAKIANDASLELMRVYSEIPKSISPVIQNGKVVFGPYEIPVTRQGYGITSEHFDYHSYDTIPFHSGIELQYGSYVVNATRFEGNVDSVYYRPMNLEHANSPFTSLTAVEGRLRNNIVLIPYPIHSADYNSFLYQTTSVYADIVLSMLNHEFIGTSRTAHSLGILFLIVIAGIAIFSIRSLGASVVIVGSTAAFLATSWFTFTLTHQYIGVVYPIVGAGLSSLFFAIIKLNHRKHVALTQLQEEKNRSHELLRNILPEELISELMSTGATTSREFKVATLLFTDFKGFTNISSTLPADRLVAELNDIFRHFDDIVVEHGLEKLKTIGDSYMIAGGLPREVTDHAIRAVKAAVAMQEYISERNRTSSIKWEMRAGIHSGQVVAGVVGKRKFTYDVWGDTVNIASRMESSGEVGQVNISAFTYDLVRDHVEAEYRGKIDAKGKGAIDMYFVKSLK